MVLSERIGVLQYIFDELVDTSSLNEKRDIVNHVPAELKEDFEFCIECLNGVHKFGFTYEPCTGDGNVILVSSVKELLEYLLEPYRTKNLTQWNINLHIARTHPYAEFLEQIVNRTLKLGIGKSILPKDGLSAMLAKKYEGKVKYSRGGYFVTEKLDGNRCIARYDGTKWIFTSRNGKIMHVDFDMSGLPTEYVYDGEVLAPPQVQMSNSIYNMIVNNVGESRKFEGVFNSTSGLINQHTLNKKLVYNIFDIMIDGVSYINRRDELDNISCRCELGDDVRILPVLARFNDASELNDNIANILNKVVDVGGEGVMINLANGSYLHKRTDELLKFKMVQSMDMKVTSVLHGSGKYEGMIGAIYCKATTPDGKEISCSVGSGLSDRQRLEWVIDANRILGKIVEVAYFDVSQNSEDKGTNRYSLRFPRLKKVREDKSETSVF
jgi:DNA ligase-1